MSILLADTKPSAEQTAQNLARWKVVLQDPIYAKIEGRVETDRYGRIIMSPPPGRRHGKLQSEIAFQLKTLMPGSGCVITECPISTSDGVKGADAAWISTEREQAQPQSDPCYSVAPEICIEIFSPGNSEAELLEKRDLYFAAGADEVWLCDQGQMRFFFSGTESAMEASALCPDFPQTVRV